MANRTRFRSTGVLALLGCAFEVMATEACSGNMRSMAGHASVDGGAASYILDIAIPTRSKAVAPAVALSYSSRNGNGTVGMGWHLNYSRSSIHRCPATIAQDGYNDNVRYVDSDRLCLDGKRLILTSGEYGKDGSTYATELFDGNIVSLTGNINDRNGRFIVRSGETRGGVYDWPLQPEGAPFPLSWLQRVIIDGDEAIEFFYQKVAADDLVIEGIRYPAKFTDDGYSTGEHFVRFEYVDRKDVASSFLAGSETRQTKLLSRIVTGTEPPGSPITLHSSYQMIYRQSLSSGRSLLRKVEGGYYDDNGSYRCFQPTETDWIDHAVEYAAASPLFGKTESPSLPEAWQPGQEPPPLAIIAVGDIDADGRRDLLHRRTDGSLRLIRVGMDLTVESDTPVPPGLNPLPERMARRSLDWRNLGAADLTMQREGQLTAVGWRDGGLSSVMGTGIPISEHLLVTDFNGDDLPDVVRGEATTEGLVVTMQRGMIFNPEQATFGDEEPLVVLPGPTDDIEISAPGALTGGWQTILIKRSGKITHLLEQTASPSKHPTTRVISADEFGIDAAAVESGPLFADLNGDGILDLLYSGPNGNWWLQINAGKTFLPGQDTGMADTRSAASRHATIVADINADGRAEVIYPAIRMQDYCIGEPSGDMLCGDQLDAHHPAMDFGIYQYHALVPVQHIAGHFTLVKLEDSGIIAQANRTQLIDVDGDGHVDVISAFDGAVGNGGFVKADGDLSRCPADFGCGTRIAKQAFVDRSDRRNANLDSARIIRRADGLRHTWNYFPLSNPDRALYTVPAMESSSRHLGRGHFYFRSSMYVVGDYQRQLGDQLARQSYSYGAAIYNSHGRGMQGFKWISIHYPDSRLRQVYWFRQMFPYTSRQEHSWFEPDRDGKRDFFDGKPGRQASFRQTNQWQCRGPAEHPITLLAPCTPHEHPVFEVSAGAGPGRARRR